jgi:superkiller protein 3
LQQYERSIQLDPDDPLSYFDYALCLKRAGRYEEALPKLLKAVELGEGNLKFGDMLFELAACHEILGNRAGAISTLQRLVEVAPRPEYYNGLGDLLQDDGDLEGAEEAYRQAITLSPHYTPAMNNLGLLLATTGRKEEGIKFYHMVLERDPDNPVAHNNLAMAYFEDGELNKAFDEIELAITADPSNPVYRYHFAQFLLDAGKKDQAILELRTALQIDPEFEEAKEALEELVGG